MEVSIDEPLNVDWDGNELLLSDILGTDEDIIYKDLEHEVDKKLLTRAMTILTDREKMIIELRLGSIKKKEKKKHRKKSLICLEFHNLTYQDWRKRSSNA